MFRWSALGACSSKALCSRVELATRSLRGKLSVNLSASARPTDRSSLRRLVMKRGRANWLKHSRSAKRASTQTQSMVLSGSSIWDCMRKCRRRWDWRDLTVYKLSSMTCSRTLHVSLTGRSTLKRHRPTKDRMTVIKRSPSCSMPSSTAQIT